MMFDRILRHVESEAHKLGVGYPSIIFGILRRQHPSIVCRLGSFSGLPGAIRLNFKLFQGKHKSDISLGKQSSEPILSFDDAKFASPVVSAGVSPSLAPTPPADGSILLS